MDNKELEEAKANIAKEMCASSYKELVKADESQMRKLSEKARRARKLKVKSRANLVVAGNPYVMLGRKVNRKGKRV